jgi:hypothetical protein
MKNLVKLILLGVFLFIVSFCAAAFGQCPSAQQTTVSFTLTDSDAQPWVGGKVTANLYNPSATQKPLCASTNQTFPLTQTITLDGAGHGSLTLTGNSAITPPGTRWTFTMQSQTSAAPTISTNILIQTGGTQNLTSVLSTQLIAPRFQAVPGSFGYLTVETLPQPCVNGNTWLDVLTHVQMVCNGGTYTPGNTVIQVNGSPLATPSPANFENSSMATISNPSAGNIQIAVTGGGGGIVPPNPTTTTYAVIGDSRNLSSTSSVAVSLAATAVNCNGTVCVVTAANTLAPNDWIGIESTFSPTFLQGNNPYFFHVLATGLSSTQFEFSYTANTGTGTGGMVEYASYLWPLLMANQPYFLGHGTVLNFNPTSGEAVADTITFYPLSIHPISPAVVGNKGFLFIQVGYEDFITTNSCNTSALPSIEANFQTLWTDAHADGWQIVEVTNPANSHANDGGACNDNSFTDIFQQFNLWLKAQAPSEVSHANGEYWDYLVDAAAMINNATVKANDPLWTQAGNPPHFTDQANENIATLANATLISGASLQLRGGCANGDGCPTDYQTNWWNPVGATGEVQLIQDPLSGNQNGWGVQSIAGGECAMFGFHDSFSVGDAGIWVDQSGTPCAGGNLYPFLSLSETHPYIYMPENIGFAWDNTFGQSTTFDTSFSRDAAGGAIDFGTGGTPGTDKSGGTYQAWVALNTAHVSGHTFDCSGTGCPGSGTALTAGTNGFYTIDANGTIDEDVNTGILNNNTPTSITLPHSIPTNFASCVCVDNGARVQTGNNQPTGCNVNGSVAPFTAINVNTPATGVSAYCRVRGN